MFFKMKTNNFCGFYKKKFRLINPLNIYKIEYWVYVVTGSWEYKSTKRWKTKLYKIYQAFLGLVYIISLIFFVMDAAAVTNDLEKLSFNLSSSFLLFVTLGKVCFFLKNKESFEDVHDKLQNHLYVKTIGVSEEDKYIFRKKAEMMTSITTGFYILLMLGFLLRVTADMTLTRAYLIPIPQRERVETYYEMIYVVQVFIIFHFLVTVLSHDLLVFSVLIRFIYHYEILEKNLLKIKNLYPRQNFEKYVRGFKESEEQKALINDVLIRKANTLEKVQKCLKSLTIHRGVKIDCIESKRIREKKTFELLKENITHHQILLRETENFCHLYSSPLLVQACGIGILIGIVILQILFASNQINALLIEQIIYVGTLLWNIFHLCTFATELTTKSKAAAEALYDIPWYEMDVKNRKIVQITLKKMMEGSKMKGGGMIIVNRVTYLKFLRISYNLIAVLRHIY